MLSPVLKLQRKRILIDVDTQRDLFVAHGVACIRNHRRVLANIRRIMAWARLGRMHTISTLQVNRGGHPHFCLEGTEGAKKIRYSLLSKRRYFEADGSTDLPRDIFKEVDQIILGKRTIDPFDEPRAERVLTEIRADECVVIGGLIEGSVKCMVLGLLQRGKKVLLVEDAVGSHEKNAAEIALRQMQAKGARLIETKMLAGASHLKRVGICECERCQGLLEKAAFAN